MRGAAGRDQRYAEAAAALWQQQARMEPMVPLDTVRAKAERLDAHTRGRNMLTGLLFILLSIKGAFEVWTQAGTLEKAADLLLLAAIAYAAYRYRRWRLAAPPAALGRTNCVEFYRAELLRQRDLARDSWGYLLPFVPGITLAILDGVLEDRSARNGIVLVLFAVALFLGIGWWDAHAARRVEAEIRALDMP